MREPCARSHRPRPETALVTAMRAAGLRSRIVAVENDYNLLVFTLNEVTEELVWIRDEVQKRRLLEATQGLEPNDEDWVNLIAIRLNMLRSRFLGLVNGADEVLRSPRDEAVFDEQPPPAPDFPPG